MTEVELVKPHTHAGRLLAPGARITVQDALARWLIEAGVARTLARTLPRTPTDQTHPQD